MSGESGKVEIVLDLDNINTRELDNIKCRVHNSIFIDGKRGSGKTFFLLNIESYLNSFDSKKSSNSNKDFYFFKPIDPTMLHDNENFLTIIIVKILNNLEESSAFIGLDENEKKSFYKKLSNVAEAIDGVLCSESCARSALELISKDQSSIKLAKYIHEFFMEVSKILDNRILILLIDDIDMAFDKGYEILEVIRKYLSSPFVIPVITGDLKQYELIVYSNTI